VTVPIIIRSLLGSPVYIDKLHANEQREISVSFSRLFDMSQAGKYTIVAHRHFLKHNSENELVVATSNQLLIVIADEP
jgi:hypothetical protein